MKPYYSLPSKLQPLTPRLIATGNGIAYDVYMVSMTAPDGASVAAVGVVWGEDNADFALLCLAPLLFHVADTFISAIGGIEKLQIMDRLIVSSIHVAAMKLDRMHLTQAATAGAMSFLRQSEAIDEQTPAFSPGSLGIDRASLN